MKQNETDVDFDRTDTPPERVLLLSVFERSYLDLMSKDLKEKIGAYKWFLDKRSYLPKGISFRDVRDNIGFNITMMNSIRQRLEECRISILSLL